MSEAGRHRRTHRRGVLAGTAVLAVAALAAAGQGGRTYAAFSDFDVVVDNVAAAGVWGTDLPLVPVECRDAGFVPVNWFVMTEEGSFWSNGIDLLVPLGPGIPGSTANGAFHGTDDDDFIVNLGPRRTLHGTGGDDCIVAGAEADILHGGPGNDVLIGGKKQHSGEFLFEAATFGALTTLASPEPLVDQVYLDGEGGADLCVPGPSDVIVNCENLGEEPTTSTEEAPAEDVPAEDVPEEDVPAEEPVTDPEIEELSGSEGSADPVCDADAEVTLDECAPSTDGEQP